MCSCSSPCGVEPSLQRRSDKRRGGDQNTGSEGELAKEEDGQHGEDGALG